ncbi:acylpyruvate hydrolase [Capronia epimyces CBS 606.96]|uniref:Acylpyruvate hydrolase n=1 Tax=Capronia epimyces CBS 606.96 TaxID=1182542 RepID=W9XUT0_9EURO|nr:acylpyruvate hydrolase [Capronia epimyces CBS 606.96]EXJ81100.1 acylpyruvate hydrolase [Capronia epimyces CBS 606.96]
MASIKSNCRKVICIGRNYADHITELSSARPAQPFFFLKPPSSILLPKQGPIVRPKGVTVHHEVELGLVIGETLKPLKNLQESDPKILDHIRSYFLGIDLTARNVQDEAKKKGLPWSIAKGFDTFLPISHEIPLDRLPDPHNVLLWLSVNGQVKQRDSTNLMLFRIPRILSDISKVMALEEGDIILTGTPKGVGPLKGGDLVQCGLEADGREVVEAKIEVEVVDDQTEGGYEFKET